MPGIFDRVKRAGPVVPVISSASVDEAVLICHRLYERGIKIYEVTLRHENALAAIMEIKSALPDDIIVGAGTVLTHKQVVDAKKAGAGFLVSPGFSRAVHEAAQGEIDLPPGVATATEVMHAVDEGYSFLKFFPAEASGGVAFLKSVQPVFPAVEFCPTGGVTASNFEDYLALPNVPIVGGSWIVD